ncbi:hypothetical protein J3459_016907 [Metarhizium acridum]|nr:hypothetical protein J3459_016907 [Metarhizium acridum]
MPSPQQSQPAGFSLFPSPDASKPPPTSRSLQAHRGRRSESQERRPQTPQVQRVATPDQHPQAPGHPSYSPPVQFEPAPAATPSNWPLSSDTPHSETPTRHHGLETTAGTAAVQQPRNAHDVPGRTETAFSEANTLVRSNSGRSRNSIAKHPLHDQPSPASASQPLRSIFPTYNPDVSLNEQEYAPTQMGPAHIPRAVISRQSVYEEPESPGIQSAPNRSQPSSPRRPAARGRWPLRIQTQPPPETPTPCTADDLKNLWKVANGWKASASESRVFCLKLSQQKDAPVYTLVVPVLTARFGASGWIPRPPRPTSASRGTTRETAKGAEARRRQLPRGPREAAAAGLTQNTATEHSARPWKRSPASTRPTTGSWRSSCRRRPHEWPSRRRTTPRPSRPPRTSAPGWSGTRTRRRTFSCTMRWPGRSASPSSGTRPTRASSTPLSTTSRPGTSPS